MPVAPVIRAFFDRLNAEHGRPAAWVFDFARDDVFLLDPAWEYLGRKEVEPALDTWRGLARGGGRTSDRLTPRCMITSTDRSNRMIDHNTDHRPIQSP